MNQEKHECIKCEHWKTIGIGTPEKTVIGDLIPEIADKTVTIQQAIDYCKLGHTKPKEENCKDFKKTDLFIC
jgi:hypothetical protein